MSEPNTVVADLLKDRFGDAVVDTVCFRDQLTVVVAAASIVEIARFCRDDERLGFEMLCDLTAVDRMPAEPRFEVVYNLYSFAHNRRLRLKVAVAENDTVATVEGVWKSANWLEREVYDLFGVVFDGHPDLRRILLWDGYVGHPLRKDYPLEGIPQKVQYR